ncbi:MAG: fatty acid oxidation complex subunit alpha FadJ [Anaeromyxobacteraceae bacterium]
MATANTVAIGSSLRNFSVTVEDGIATVLVDVPGEPVNTISPGVGSELSTLVDALGAAAEVKAVVVGSGKKDGFIAGAHIDTFQALTTAKDAEALARELQGVYGRLEKLGKPVVAAIHGACLGGGLELALACTYRVASDDPKTVLGNPEVQLGLIPGAGGTQRLPRLVGLEAGLDLVLTGKSVKARKARKLGLVDETPPRELLLDVARRRAAELAGGSLDPEASRHRDGALAAVRSAALTGNPAGRALLFRQAKAALLRSTKGNYPAPERALEVIAHGFAHGMEEGLALEAKRFGELAVTDVSRRLVEIFFASTALKKDRGVDDPAIQPRKVERVGMLGGGFMGSGIAFVTVSAGVPVRLRDRDDALVGKSLAIVRGLLEEKVKRRKLDKRELFATLRLVTGTTDWSGLASADLVIEAVFEDLELKRQVLRDLEAVNPGAIFATNTSALPITKIAEAARHPENVVGMHYFSPVHKMPLLEVVAAERSSPEAIATAVAFGKRQGKTPIVVKDGPGFYTNRILAPYVNEAARLLVEGAAIGDIDRALVRFGFKVGPITLLDEVGIDVAAKVSKVMHDAFGERLAPPRAIQDVLAAGRLGRKNKQGFYTYGSGKKHVDETVYDVLPGGRDRKSFPAEELVERVALPMVNEAIRCVGERVVRSARDADMAAVFGIGFPPFRGGPIRYADALGAAKLLEKLEALRAKHGERFEPAPLLIEMARAGRRFHG